MDEFALIAEYFAGDDGAAVGIGDDAAVVDVPPGNQLAVAVDTLVAGRHFPPQMPAAAVGHRALAVNLSDLAAMGAEPRWYTLALTLPAADDDWLAAFARGLRDLGRAHGSALIGGDTTRGPLTITVQALGLIAGPPLMRRGAAPGDRVFVGGWLGDGAGGLADVERGADSTLAHRFLLPQPQLALGRALAGIASACIDVSDGLAADLGHILAASGAGATIDWHRLPVSPELVASVGDAEARRLALAGGDDYVLCFTVPPDRDAACLSTCHEIGTVTRETGLRIVDADGRPVEADIDGYRHF